MNPHDALARTVLLIHREVYPSLTGDQIVNGLTGHTVRLRADEPNVRTPAGQTAVVASAVLSAQLGVRLIIDVPNVPLVVPQPPVADHRLATGLLELVDDLVTPACRDLAAPSDLTLLFGDVTARDIDTGVQLRLTGSDWSMRLALAEAGELDRWAGIWPFGGLLGGVAASAEVFRAAMVALGQAYDVEPAAAHRIGPPEVVELELDAVYLTNAAVHLGDFDFISGGAITNACLFALLRIAHLSGHARVFDEDRGDTTNLNRYALLRRSLLGIPKVELLASHSSSEFGISPSKVRLDDATVVNVLPLSDNVIVGVDHVPSRWLAQREARGWLCVGGTSGFEILVSEHEPGTPCTGCLHPFDDLADGPIPTVSFVSAFAGFMQAYRLIARASGRPLAMPTLAYPLNLSAPMAIMRLGQFPRADCPVHCDASRGLAA